MTEQESREYETLWAWFKALDAATDTFRPIIHATPASNLAEGATAVAHSNSRRGHEDQKAVRIEWAVACV